MWNINYLLAMLGVEYLIRLWIFEYFSGCPNLDWTRNIPGQKPIWRFIFRLFLSDFFAILCKFKSPNSQCARSNIVYTTEINK